MALDACLRSSGKSGQMWIGSWPRGSQSEWGSSGLLQMYPSGPGSQPPNLYIPYSASSQKVIPGWSGEWDGETSDSSFLPFLPQGVPGGSVVKNLPAMKKTSIWSLGRKDTLEKEEAIHSSILPWEIPRTEEPGLHGVAKSQTQLSG